MRQRKNFSNLRHSLLALIAVCMIASAPAAAQTLTGGGAIGFSGYKTSNIPMSTMSATITRIDNSGVQFMSENRTPAIVTFCAEFWSPDGAGVALTLVLDRTMIPAEPSSFVFPDGVVVDASLDVAPETKCFHWGANQIAKNVFHKFEVWWNVVGVGEVLVGNRTISVLSGDR